MSTKSLADQIADLQAQTERLQEYDRLLDKAVRLRFGADAKTIEKALKCGPDDTALKRLKTYFDLQTESDCKRFVDIMCNESSLHYYQSQCGGGAEQG